MSKAPDVEGVSFSLISTPVPASRPKVGKFGAFYPKRHTQYKEWLRQQLASETIPSFKIEGLVELDLTFVMPHYKTSDYPTHRADLDNLSKLPMDSMTDSGKFWEDDSLVAKLTTSKRFTEEDEEPHTLVHVKPLV